MCRRTTPGWTSADQCGSQRYRKSFAAWARRAVSEQNRCADVAARQRNMASRKPGPTSDELACSSSSVALGRAGYLATALSAARSLQPTPRLVAEQVDLAQRRHPVATRLIPAASACRWSCRSPITLAQRRAVEQRASSPGPELARVNRHHSTPADISHEPRGVGARGLIRCRVSRSSGVRRRMSLRSICPVTGFLPIRVSTRAASATPAAGSAGTFLCMSGSKARVWGVIEDPHRCPHRGRSCPPC